MDKVPSDYKPSHRIYELAQDNQIPIEFVNGQIKEFIFYWQERQIRRKSWERTFWAWVKKGWEWKQEKERKQVKTRPAAYQEFEMEKIKVADRSVALAALRELGLRKYR